MQVKSYFELRILALKYCRHIHWEWPHLRAPFWRLCWNRNNGGILIQRDLETRMRPEAVYLITPDTDYHSRSENSLDQLFIHFLVGQPFHAALPGIIELPFGKDAETLLQRVVAEASTGALETISCRASTYGLCAWALAQLPADWFAELCPDPVIAAVEERMDKNLHRSVQNLEFAAWAKLELRTFMRRFKAATGTTCQDVFRRKRIAQACLMLHFSDQTIEEVAANCGFADRHHFTRVFARERGMSPARYRRLTGEIISQSKDGVRYVLQGE